MCNARLIWGGDNSISNIRKFPLDHRAIDIAFADRYSFCVIKASEVLKLKKDEVIQLIKKFYNDTYLVDQNACSSPHLIVWIGNQVKKAREIFWKNLYDFVVKRYDMPDTASVDKYTQLCRNILSLENLKKNQLTLFLRIDINDL